METVKNTIEYKEKQLRMNNLRNEKMDDGDILELMEEKKNTQIKVAKEK